jgi:hypothetical protein
LAASPPAALAQKFYTYVGDIGPGHVLLAWGTTEGDNTIGRTSESHGQAVVRVGTQEARVTDKNFAVVRGLTPDTEYAYEVLLKGRKIGGARIRTWPQKADRLKFFVIGDFGDGSDGQRRVAEAMWNEFQKHWGENPVRFVLTTGDNIYGQFWITLRFRNTGNDDDEWEKKFFAPYEPLIARIPFYPSLGNHDGNETESREDLTAYLDNFFFPTPDNKPARYYRFSFGGLADFFALDTTTNTEKGPPSPTFEEGGDQHNWLKKNLAEARVPWKIPYMHHPPFNAGPNHPAAANDLEHFMKVFEQNGVKVVFSGHEHNFQFSEKNGRTGGIRYIVSGAGGELRRGDVRSVMKQAQIEGWAAQRHFTLVEIEGSEMRVTPISYEEVAVVDPDHKKIEMPLKATVD